MKKSLSRILSVLLSVCMLLSSVPVMAEGSDGENVILLNGSSVPGKIAMDDEPELPSDTGAPEKQEEQKDAGSPALFGVAVVDKIDQPEEPELTEQTIAVTLFTDSSAAHQSHEPAVPTKNLLKGTKTTLAAPQKAGGKADDGKAPDGKADDGETTISITGELPEGAYAIGWPVDIGDEITEETDDGLTREAEVLGAYQLELYNADGTKIENTDTPITVNLNLAPKLTKSGTQEPDRVEVVPLSQNGKADTGAPMENRGSGSSISVTTSVLRGLVLLFNWHYVSFHTLIAFTPSNDLGPVEWALTELALFGQRVRYTNVICPEGQTALEAVTMDLRGQSIIANILIRDLPTDGTYTLYGIADAQGNLSENYKWENVKVGDLIKTPTDIYGFALIGDETEQTLTAEDPNGTYRVTVRYDDTALIPMYGTRLEVVEIELGSDQYEACYARAGEAMNDMEEGRLFDIRIVNEETGESYEPAEGTLVNVLIELLKTNYRAGEGARIVHLLDDNTVENLTVVVTPDGDDYKYSFQTGSLSPFMVGYTVDFYYNGYEYSIPGDTGILLSELFEELDINAPVADVANVAFTNSSLVSVAEEGQDWRLTSLQPFDTEETLTVTLTDGSKIEIKVLDAKVDNEADANFKVINRSNGNASQQTVTYWENFGEAVAQANISTSAYPAKIEVLKNVTITDTSVYSKAQALTIEGNNHTITRGTGLSGNLISVNSASQALTISKLTIDNGNTNATGNVIRREITANMAAMTLDNVTIKGGNGSGNLVEVAVTSGTRTINVAIKNSNISMENSTGSAVHYSGTSANNSSLNVNNTTITGCSGSSDKNLINIDTERMTNIEITGSRIYRGQTTGTAVLNSSGGTTQINNSIISGAKSATDSASVSATSPLIRQGTGAMTLTDAAVSGHAATATGACAVDAINSNSVTVSGSTSIVGNTAGGVPANLRIPSEAAKAKIGALSGNVGITTTENAHGNNFANLTSYTETSGIPHLSNDANALLKAVRGNARNDTKLYWVKSEKTPTSRFYVTGNLSIANNVTIYYDTLEEAAEASSQFTGAVTIYSMVSEYTMVDPITISKDTTLQPGVDASGNTVPRLVIKRGSETGILIVHNSGAFILKDVTLDGENVAVTSSLFRGTAGAGALTLENVTVQNHTATADDIYAMDVSDMLSKVYLKGDVQIHSNTANAKNANLAIGGINRLTVAGELTGNVGVANVLHYMPGEQFGVVENTSYSLGTITNDMLDDAEVDQQGTNLFWKAMNTSSGPVVKLKDENGNLLYTNANATTLAVFNTLEEIVDPLNNYVYKADKSVYTGKIYVEFLRDVVKSGTGDRGVSITKKRDLVFKTADKNATDGYPFQGVGTRTKILFMNGGGNGNTNARFKFTGDGSTIRFENIIVDGRADQGIVADQGALVSVGFVGQTHNTVFTLGPGAILQNGASNFDDQGGGVYVGRGCKMYMEPGSIIQYCHSDVGNNASGGAIYLAEGELYCDGGIIRNCVSINGGAVELGGATDGAQSDKARIYFSGSPQIIDNYSRSGDPLNVHLYYDSNAIINVVGDLSTDARIGIYPDDRSNIYERHGKEGKPFATIAEGVNPVNLDAFVNDRDPRLTGEQSTNSSNTNLVVWFYKMNAVAMEDYVIDDVVIRTTEISGSEGTFHPTDALPITFTFEELESVYRGLKNYTLNKKSTYDHIVLEEYTTEFGTNAEVSNGITGLRLAVFELGKRWEYSQDNGTTWQPVNGREIAFHYSRENRDNIKLIKNEDTNPADMLENVQFRLERSFPTASSYSLYTNGAGKGRNKANGDEVKDESNNGIYTTDANGSFIMNLPEGYYRLTETVAPGYELMTAPVTFHVGVTAVPETAEADESPYSVDTVSVNATYAGNDYDTWNSDKIFGTMTVSNVRQVPLHVLVQKGVDEYEQDDSLRTTEYVTAALGSTTGVDTLNQMTSVSGYENYKIYYGSESSGQYTFVKSGEDPIEVASLQGTVGGILVNGENAQVITKGQAIYYIVYEEPRMVPYHILLNENGAITEKANWATNNTTAKHTTTDFIVDATGVDVLNAYGETMTDSSNNKTYRRAKVVYASPQTATMNGIELVWLVNTPEAVAARETQNASTDIGLLSSTDAVYIIYNAGYDLTVTKNVTGAMGDQTKEFTIYIVSDDLNESSYHDDVARNYSVETVTGVGKCIALTLRHGQSVTLKELPEGDYTISEADTGESYEMSCTYRVGASGTTTPGTTFSLTDDSIVTVTNNLNAVSPTDVSFTYVPYLLMLLCGAALMLIRKKRSAR